MSYNDCNKNIQSCLSALLILFIGISCSANTDRENSNQPEKSDLNIEKVLEIGENSDDNSDAPPLSFAANVATDSKGNIFIYDRRASKIFVYNQSGNYQHAIGREGSGPGEIGQLTTMYVDSKDRLVTADRENARITVYNTDGEVLNSRSALGINHIRDIREMPDDRYLLTGWDGDHFLHITDSEFTDKISSFGTISDFDENREDTELRWLQMMSGFAQPISDTKIAFTPHYYQGSIYSYEKAPDSEVWELQKTTDGYQTIEAPVQFTSSEPESDEKLNGMMMNSDGRLYILNEARSLGFYQQENDLVHFSLLINEDISEFVIERLGSPNLELQQYQISDTLNVGRSSHRQVQWMDSQNRLFVTDNADIPKVEIFQIQ